MSPQHQFAQHSVRRGVRSHVPRLPVPDVADPTPEVPKRRICQSVFFWTARPGRCVASLFQGTSRIILAQQHCVVSAFFVQLRRCFSMAAIARRSSRNSIWTRLRPPAIAVKVWRGRALQQLSFFTVLRCMSLSSSFPDPFPPAVIVVDLTADSPKGEALEI